MTGEVRGDVRPGGRRAGGEGECGGKGLAWVVEGRVRGIDTGGNSLHVHKKQKQQHDVTLSCGPISG